METKPINAENDQLPVLAPASCSAPAYFFLPNLPRDIWYGYADKPEKAELAAFVNQRHAHISQSCDAEMFCHALNGAPHFDRQTLELVMLHAENKRLRADLKEAQRALEDDGEFNDERECMQAYLDDNVTIGQLVRWINAEAVNAGRNGDRDYLGALARIGEQVEAAHSLYRSSLPNV